MIVEFAGLRSLRYHVRGKVGQLLLGAVSPSFSWQPHLSSLRTSLSDGPTSRYGVVANQRGVSREFDARLSGGKMEIALVRSYAEKPWRSPATYQLIEDALREKWRVRSINTEDPETLYNFLSELRQESNESVFAFNIAEYLDERNKEGFLPALLDEWNIPHLGSSAEVVAIGLDKAKTKELLIENQIPTPRSFVAKEGDSHLRCLAERIGYPLFVKPIREGGHIGIGDDSIVYDDANLERAIHRIFDHHNQPALVEEYVTGEGLREFSVGIIDDENRLFTPYEIDYESMGVKTAILTCEGMEKGRHKAKPVRDEKICDELIDLAERTHVAVGARDYSRVDIRTKNTGYYVLEINIMPGLGPRGFLAQAAIAIHALEHNQLIQKLAEVSMNRART